MLNNFSTKAKINTLLGVSIVVLSVYTIIWNFDMRTLYLKLDKVEVKYNKTMAIHKQLLTEHSQIVSGNQIKDRAIKSLKMEVPRSTEQILL
ncbi:cell division protein FtsL [Candidatus Thioglobus sp.]|jgi:Cell division protein FtsL.|uniref:cell division protein FtsL n=1 Tax=Candidatus Thioglobus sp. TaxID=2026721 RepID=UPI003242A922